ncbi:MAG: hypothetical protein ACE5HP_06180 [Gemmatimonadota bacterium]
MRLALRFLGRAFLWTSGFMALVLLSALLSGEEGDVLVLHVTRWVAGALIFSAFPAGIAVAEQVVRWTRPRLGPPAGLMLGAGILALLVFLIRGYVGPAVVRDEVGTAPEERAAAALGGAGRIGPIAEQEAASLYFHERPRVLRLALEAVEARGDRSVEAWRPVNRIAWEMDGTVVGSLLALVLAGIGVLAGAWARWTARRELRQAQYWALGLFLLVTTYLMGENSYELLLLHMAAPAFFAAWLPLIAPTMLLMGLALATAARLLGASVTVGSRAEGAG